MECLDELSIEHLPLRSSHEQAVIQMAIYITAGRGGEKKGSKEITTLQTSIHFLMLWNGRNDAPESYAKHIAMPLGKIQEP
ncbi:unnamed protein product [Linum tenue]|uniref:Uncharacterized protein n=1 Tax=Linum tenue TaxID=586396 RepID=A0AAV0N891_9ROSI|nr:unnamed protein product [Linum tenue]